MMNLREFFQDDKGDFSFKRLQTGVYLFLFLLLFFVNLFTGKTVSQPILEFLIILNMYSYTGVVVESFRKSGAKTLITRDATYKEVDQAPQPTTEVPNLPAQTEPVKTDGVALVKPSLPSVTLTTNVKESPKISVPE